MLFGKYRIRCFFETEAFLPSFKGSTFRGVFGVALKRVVCALKHLECKECLLNTRCLYSRVFENIIQNDGMNGKIVHARPRPFVIEPPVSAETHYLPGDSFDFNLIIFGEDNKNLGYFIYALDSMGKVGIGKRINGKRGVYRLDTVTYGDTTVYSAIDGVLVLPDRIEDIKKEDLMRKESCTRLRFITLTPLRVKFRNRLTDSLPFHVLVRAMLRRISSLFAWFGDDGELDLDYEALIQKAETVKTVSSDLRWLDRRRYSNRQERAMMMGGVIGEVVYEGNMAQFIPLLNLCRKFHLGKLTTFGLGKIDYEILE